MMYFEAGVDFLLFEPQKIWQTIRGKDGTWGEPEVIIDAVEVPWDVKTRSGVTYMTTYTRALRRGRPHCFQDHYRWQDLGVLQWD